MALHRSLRDPNARYEVTVRPAIVYLDDLEVICGALSEASRAEHKRIDNDELEALQGLTVDELGTLRSLLAKTDSPRRRDDAAVGVRERTFTEIRAGSALAESLDDLTDARPEELRDIRISTTYPLVVCTLGRNYAQIWTLSRNSEARALVDEIAGFLKTRRGITAILRSTPPILWWLNALSLIAGAVILSFGENPRRVIGVAAISAYLLATTVAMVIWRARKFGGAIIHAVRRSEAKGLSASARRSVAIAATSGLAGAIVTALVAIWRARSGQG